MGVRVDNKDTFISALCGEREVKVKYVNDEYVHFELAEKRWFICPLGDFSFSPAGFNARFHEGTSYYVDISCGYVHLVDIEE
jgi:hypothetical protein